MALKILTITGASGSGKTTLTLGLRELALPSVECYIFDHLIDQMPDISNIDPETDCQSIMFEYWVSKLQKEKNDGIAIIDTQIRPYSAQKVLIRQEIEAARVVLIDCEIEKRHQRLLSRGQAELINSDMDCWAAYLRGQADALDLHIIDTSDRSIDDGIRSLKSLIAELYPDGAREGTPDEGILYR